MVGVSGFANTPCARPTGRSRGSVLTLFAAVLPVTPEMMHARPVSGPRDDTPCGYCVVTTIGTALPVHAVMASAGYGLPVVGEVAPGPELHAALTAQRLDELIVADAGLDDQALLEIVDGAHRLGVKVRVARPGLLQRCAAHAASKTDADEAFLAGQAAVKAAIAGETDKMVVLVRGDTDHYTCETGLAPLSEIANGVKKLPPEWINEDGVSMNFQFFRYALPLIQGEVPVPYENGLPLFARLEKHRIEKALPPYEV